MKKNILFLIILFFLFSSNVFGGEKIKVGTIERPPFAMKINNEWTGLSVDIAKKVAEKNNLNLDFNEYEVFGEMISAVENKKVDLAAANITMSSKREEKMDFSQPIYDSGLLVAIPNKAEKISYWKIIWDSGIIKFIAFALVVLLVMAHLLWFFERGKEHHRHDYFRDDYLGGIWDAFWWAFIIMTMGGFENEVPSSKFSRFLAMFWIVVSLFFVSTLTAKITSSLTVSELQSGINSYKDLKNKKVGVMNSPVIKDFLTQEGISTTSYKKFDKLMLDLKNGKLNAVVADAPVLAYYVKEKGEGKIKIIGDIFKPEKYGILFPAGSKYKEIFDREILRMKENGEYQKLWNKYFENK